MAKTKQFQGKEFVSGPNYLRVESGALIAAANVAGRIQNFKKTSEGTLISTNGVTPYVPDYGDQGHPYPSYGTMRGIFHARVSGGERDLLLVHTGEELWSFDGWSRTFEKLVASSGAQIIDELYNSSQPQFPTQFVSTPNGIIVVSQGGSPKAYFYDGEVIGTLGYSTLPGPPQGNGPTTEAGSEDNTDTNEKGYSVVRVSMGVATDMAGGIPVSHFQFGSGRIGTVDSSSSFSVYNGATMVDASAGNLHSGRWAAATQWVDRWGNLSPLSSPSDTVKTDPRRGGFNASPTSAKPLNAIQHQFLWTGINEGPVNTIGRVLLRTKDQVNSGSVDLFEVPGNASGALSGLFATIPDNSSDAFPDNVPDGWLIKPATRPIPVPDFRVCTAAMGRLWIANTTADPGVVIPSMPGRWGTFLQDGEIRPDPTGSQITGLASVPGGLLAFTENSTFMIVPSTDGRYFQVATLHSTIGCVAPSSIQTLPGGVTVWLGHGGFYAYAGDSVQKISEPIQYYTDKINAPRAMQAVSAIDHDTGEYICWVPFGNSKVNNHAFVFDGTGWRERTDEKVAAVCVTSDHRRYMLAAGKSTDNLGAELSGIWLLEHQSHGYTPAAKNFVIETAWLSSEQMQRVSAYKIRLWLRETSATGTATIDVFTNWRTGATPDHSVTVELDAPDDTPPTWDATLLGSGAEWIRRRPFWEVKDIAVTSAEVFKIRITSTIPIEFGGLAVHENFRPGSLRTPRG